MMMIMTKMIIINEMEWKDQGNSTMVAVVSLASFNGAVAGGALNQD